MNGCRPNLLRYSSEIYEDDPYIGSRLLIFSTVRQDDPFGSRPLFGQSMHGCRPKIFSQRIVPPKSMRRSL